MSNLRKQFRGMVVNITEPGEQEIQKDWSTHVSAKAKSKTWSTTLKKRKEAGLQNMVNIIFKQAIKSKHNWLSTFSTQAV